MARATFVLLFSLFAVASAVCPTVQYSTGTRFSAVNFAAGANINIAAGQVYLFDLPNSPIYGNINVQGTLVFADEQNVTLNAAFMYVGNGGKLIIGSCDCPFTNKATLTFYGTDKSINNNNYGTKGLAVGPQGTALLYGELFGPSWTTIATSVNAGATQMTLSENVNWKVGDQLVIASTDYSQDQAEKVTVTSIINPTTVAFTPALVYGHHSGTYYGLSEKAEVARLTRNILIQGDAGSDATRFGVHTMFAFDFTEVRLSGVQVFRGGQAGVLARYPIHFHFANDTSERAFIKDCTVHESYQRCFTIHHTDSLLIQRNVGYKARGHCFFLEDGIETNNKFYWNLGMQTLTPFSDTEQLIPTDDDPAVFWVTNPNNTFVSNVAAGGRSHCWWIALPVNPMGPSATPTMCPRRTPLQYFAHNKAHSCGQDCMHIDRGPDANGDPGGSAVAFDWPDASGNNRWERVGAGYNPVANPTGLDQTDVRVEAKFENFHAYRCQSHGTWTRNGLVSFYQPIYADNAIGITFATNGGYGMLQDGIFIGQTANMGNPSNYERNNNKTGYDGRTIPSYGNQAYPIRGYEFYDGPNTAANVRCYAFQDNPFRQASCISMLRQDEFQISSTNQAYDVLIPDGSVPVNFPDWLHDGDRQSVFIDQDGSVTGRPPVGNQKVVVTNRAQFLRLSSCVDLSATRGVLYCPNQYGRIGWDWSASDDPTFWPAPAGLDSLARLSRSDQAAGIYMPVCGGACNSPPNTDGKTLSVPRRSFQMTTPLSPVLPATRDIMLNFMHSPPSRLNLRLTYTDAFYDAATGIRNELMLAICVGTSTRFFTDTVNPKTASYGYNAQDPVVNAAPSLAALRTNPIYTSYPNRGKGMWFLDTTTGYLYIRFAPVDNRTAANLRDAYPAIEATFRFINVPSTVASCPTLTGGSGSDRGIPPTAAVAAPPAFAAPAPNVARDDSGSLCSATSPPVGNGPVVAVAGNGATAATVDTGTTTVAATTSVASLTVLSTVTTSEASISLSTTAQSTTSTSFAASTTGAVTTTTQALSTSTSSVSTANSASTTAASNAATTSVSSSTTAASTVATTTRSASTTTESTTVAAVADATVAATLTSSTTTASTAASTTNSASTTAASTDVATSLNAVSASNSATTVTAADAAAATAAAVSTANSASATSVVSSTFVAATNAASTTTTAAATVAASTTSLNTLTASTTVAESTTVTAATTSGTAPQTFTITLNWCPADIILFAQELAAGLAAYASEFLGRPVSPSEFNVVVICPSTKRDSAPVAEVTYTGGDSAIVGVLVNAINDNSLQSHPSFTAACTGTCPSNVATARTGTSGGGKKVIPVWVWIVIGVVVFLVIAGLIALAVFFYLKLRKGGVRTSSRAPLRPMYNLDEMYNTKGTA